MRNSHYQTDVYKYTEFLLNPTKTQFYLNPAQTKTRKGRAKDEIITDTPRTIKERFVANIWHYVISELLHWTPEEAMKCMNKKLVSFFMLDKIYDSFFYSAGVRKFADDSNAALAKCINLAFPDAGIHFDERSEIVVFYLRNIIQNEHRNESEGSKRLSQGFFSNPNDGFTRMEYVMQHYNKNELSGLSLWERYEFFNTRKKANAWLKEKKLFQAGIQNKMYKSPMALYHNTAAPEDQDTLIYLNFLINNLVDEIKKQP